MFFMDLIEKLCSLQSRIFIWRNAMNVAKRLNLSAMCEFKD